MKKYLIWGNIDEQIDLKYHTKIYCEKCGWRNMQQKRKPLKQNWNITRAMQSVAYPLRLKIWPGDLDLWPMTLKINRIPDSFKDWVCSKFGQNPLKDVDSRVFTRMLRKDGSVTIPLRNFVGEGIINDTNKRSLSITK